MNSTLMTTQYSRTLMAIGCKVVILFFLFLSANKVVAQTCGNTWLNISNYNGGVTIGDLDVPGNQITVEGKFNRVIPYTRNRFYAGDIVSKHTDPRDANYLLRPNSAEITTEDGYFATPAICDIELNKTYHVAMVYDGKTLKFYRNGFLMSQVAASGSLIQNNLLTTIGDLAYQPGYGQEGMVGFIDEVRIWNVARTQTQLRTYLNKPLPNPSTQNGLLAYYTFNDLKNKQGNSLWNGTVFGNGSFQNLNPTCSTYKQDSCALVVNIPNIVDADFSVPDSVCVNEPINIQNLTTGASSLYWNFCVADINQTPVGTNLGNLGGQLSQPVFIDIAQNDNGDYYAFSINHISGELIRHNFGNSYLNNPVVENLGNYNGAIPAQAEGIQIIKDKGIWYAVIVGGGNNLPNSSPRIVTINFGNSLASNTSTATNWGNIGSLSQPIDLHVFQEGDVWYAFTVNATNNTITRFSFPNGLNAAPTGNNLGGFGLLNYPDGIFVINDNGYWRAFVTNSTNASLTRLDFGNSLLNNPSAVDLGNPDNKLYNPRDINVIKFCGEAIVGFVVNANTNELVRLDFTNGLSQPPVAVNLGNTGNLSVPHSLSKLFRVGADLFSFITNVTNNTITRLQFTGCTNSNTPNSSDSIPPPITYNTPGVYNINLMVDEGLPTQTSICKTVVVKDCIVQNPIVVDFDLPDTVCVNTPVTITNKTIGASTFYWNFNVTDINSTPTGTNLGNIGNMLNTPVFTDFVSDNGNYYVFVVNNNPGNLVRLDFGNSLLNTPTATDLGNFGGSFPGNAEGIQVVHVNDKWYALVVGGDPSGSTTPKIVKIDFGTTLSNNSPVITDWNNIGGLSYPHDLYVFADGNSWYGFAVNARDNTITRFSFGTDFSTTPIGVNLGNLGGLNTPVGVYAANDNGYWRVFVTNGGNSTITRLDFGSSLLNTPTAINIGNPGSVLNNPRDIHIIEFCGETVGLTVNGNTNDLVKLNFNNNLSTVPTASSLGNIGNLSFPHSISKLFRVGADLYSFITNVNNNTITRIRFAGSNNASIPNLSDSIPPQITYTVPGVYNVNVMVDEGLPTQTSLCKSILVVPSPVKTPIFDTAFCSADSILLTTSFPLPYTWNTGVKDNDITVKQPGTYWVETNYYGCVVRDSINTIQSASPIVNLGADTAICRLDSLLINAGNSGATYLWNNGSTSQTIYADTVGTYIVRVTNTEGCVSADSLILANHAAIQLSVTNDTTICTGSTFSLQANGNNVQTYSWSPGSTLSDVLISNPVASPVDTTKYFINVTDIYGCKESDSVLVNVAPLPTVTALADTSICAGNSVTLSTNATQGVSYSWSPSAGLSSNTASTPVATPNTSTNYIITVITAAGCNAVDSVLVNVNPLPQITASSADSLICIGNSTVVSASSPTVVFYNWSPSQSLSDQGAAFPTATPASTTNYVVEGTDINGCKIKDSIVVAVKQLPLFVINPATASVCKGESVTITASGGDQYAWYPPTGLSVIDQAVTVATPDVSTTYKAVITDNVCNITDSVFTTVNITSLSNIDVTKSNDVDCIIGTSTLRATGGVVYNWSPGNYLSDSTIASPVAAPLETTTYYVQVSNALGCTGIDSITVNVFKGTVENGYKLPTAFTPNGDGINDCFNVRKWGTLAALDFSVYNRWGTLLFHTRNASECWDGTYKGQLQPPGAYVYQIRAQALCGTVYRKGTVVLIR